MCCTVLLSISNSLVPGPINEGEVEREVYNSFYCLMSFSIATLRGRKRVLILKFLSPEASVEKDVLQ